MSSRAPEHRIILTTDEARHNALSAVSALPSGRVPPWVVEVYEYRRNRTLAQNRLYWYWLGIIARHISDTGAAQVIDEDTGEITSHVVTSEDLHEFYRTTFLPERVVQINGRVRRARKSTATLTVSEFKQYLNEIEFHAQDRMELYLPHTPDWFEAMGAPQ